jgi:hypothetical protein
MPLRDLAVSLPADELPTAVADFIREAERRIEQFQDDCCVAAFVPSNFTGAYRLLRALAASGDLRGRQFCEWGSGFGVVAGLAAMLGFDSTGIEVEGELVTEARKLADDFGLPVTFSRGSFLPRGTPIPTTGAGFWLTTDAAPGYGNLGLDPCELDVVFAYPWPSEQDFVGDLFEWAAGAGAVLATYHVGGEFRVRRKVGKGSGRRG